MILSQRLYADQSLLAMSTFLEGSCCWAFVKLLTLREMMDRLGSYIRSVSRPRFEEDYTDRLNYKVTSYLLLACAIAILAKEYGGEPIACWGRAEWPGGWLQYAHDICFVENTYYIPLNETVPRQSAERERREINYYQWVPFILALQAVFFNIPHVFWRSVNSTFGIDVRAVITMADSTKGQEKIKDKNETRDMIAAHLSDRFKLRNANLSKRKANLKAEPELGPLGIVTSAKLLCRWFSKNFLGITYVLTKFMFLVNLVGQFIFIGYFLGKSSNFWGFHTLGALTRGETWDDTGHFPRVTICDFQIRHLANINRHSVQCVLMANMFNEKIFVGLYYWVLLVLVVTVFNIIRWKYWLIHAQAQEDFLEELLIPARDIAFPKITVPAAYEKPQEELSEKIRNKLYWLDVAKKTLKVVDGVGNHPALTEMDLETIELTKEEKDKLELTDEEMAKLKLTDAEKKQLELSEDEKKKVEEWNTEAKKREEFFEQYQERITNRKFYKGTIRHNLARFSAYIGADGILVFRLMDKNAGVYITSAVACLVFKNFATNNGIKFVDENNNNNNNMRDYYPSSVVLHSNKNGHLA
uniref:Innexin n=1 Tax=Acrobeloides nanus TaxID=290746 RepID=A0A914DW71_9BILA